MSGALLARPLGHVDNQEDEPVRRGADEMVDDDDDVIEEIDNDDDDDGDGGEHCFFFERKFDILRILKTVNKFR